VFRAAAKGRDLQLDNAGVIGSNEVFQDLETGSRWQQSGLQAISGPLKGEHLKLYPFLLTDWGEWHRLHPDTLVLKPLPGYADRIPERNEMIRQGLSGEGVAPPGVLRVDDRLKPKTMVLGLAVGGCPHQCRGPGYRRRESAGYRDRRNLCHRYAIHRARRDGRRQRYVLEHFHRGQFRCRASAHRL